MDDTPDTESLRHAWIAAFNAHDLDSHAALYTEDAMLFGSDDTLHRGRAGIRSYFAGRPPGAAVKHYPVPELVQLGPDTAVTAAFVDFTDGATLMPYRVTWTLVRRDGNWRIAQHHGSPRRQPQA